MKRNHSLTKRLLSVLLCVSLIAAYIPTVASAADLSTDYYSRIVDESSMDAWKNYFDLREGYQTTANAGGVWTDKSVFADASAFGGKISMLDGDRNFLTALSAIAANKEVVGYATLPTDTVLVLDLSNSMAGYENTLIRAANDAIRTLLDNNENNRVGVVLYSGHNSNSTSSYAEGVTRILDIDRYTAAGNGTFLTYRNDEVSVTDGVVSAAGKDLSREKDFDGATYIQAGLWEAMKMFLEMDTVIGDNNWQENVDRMPILVLMSDGAPTTGTSYYDNVENSQYTQTTGGGPGGNQQTTTVYKSNIGNGRNDDLRPGNVFLTQLTAAYVMSQIEAHYQQVDPDVRGLFYTLGFNVQNNEYAKSVLDPDSSTLTDSLWSAYNRLTTGTLSVNVKNRNGGNSDVAISKNSYVTDKSYVDEYFAASTSGLANAFETLVNEIILQSRYYPTHLEGGSPDFSGYVDFTDTLGEYMEVKDIKGILLGSTLFDGHMMASKLESTQDGLGTVENPTELGMEFISSIMNRLGISSRAEAEALVANAVNAGQLYYNSASDWSNYIGWYAKADGSFLGFWNEGVTTQPADAVYKIRSYGFLGETTGSIKDSDMMYMTVQVRTNIATGQQTVIWKIPASLVPLITYEVSLKGANVDEAEDVVVSVENADTVSPIRLVFESGLRSDLNELNITRIEDSAHIAADGVTRQFWTNYFDISAADHEHHVTAMAEFTPSKENERFYYTFHSAVFRRSGSEYILLGENETPDSGGEYYHRRYIFKDGSDTPVFFYEQMSRKSIEAAVWKGDYVTMTGETGAWIVEAGTPARELSMYSALKADEERTQSAHMIFYPYLSEHNNTMYVDMNLGNNGLLQVTPAQGIKLSKTVDVYETGTSDSFRFRITARNADGTPYTGAADSYRSDLDVVPMGAPARIEFSAAGIYEVELKKDQSFWMVGLPAGTAYTIEEVSENEDYRVKSVHVNNVSTGYIAAGTVAQYYVDDVAFVNTAVGEGDLVITKQVIDVSGNPVAVSENLEFTAQVTLTDSSGAPVSGVFESSNGQLTVPETGIFTVKLAAEASFVLRGIPEGTAYTVQELDIPDGFRLDSEKSKLQGVVDASDNDQVLIVNVYEPRSITGGSIDLTVTKRLEGSRTQWLSGERYEFVIHRLNPTRAAEEVTRLVITDQTPNKTATYDLSGETFAQPGTYYYSITEQPGSQGGVTYDTVSRRFQVVVADQDMDGDLEIVSVNNEVLTTVTGSYHVAAQFTNVYEPTGSATVAVNVQKEMIGNHSLYGFQFALYSDATLQNEILRSTPTNAAGQASLTLTYAANRAGQTYTYYLAEIDQGNANITYSAAVYKVEVTVTDNLDGTISAETVVTAMDESGKLSDGVPVFVNTHISSTIDYLAIGGMKEILGDRVLNAGEFGFTIEAVTEGAPMPGITTVYNGANGAFAFQDMEFTAVGQYRYIVREILPENPIGGFTYDPAYFAILVEVTQDGQYGLYADVREIHRVVGQTVTTVSDIVFVNTYAAEADRVTISGEKLLTGKTLEEGEFSFRLEAVTEGAPMPADAVVRNAANGRFTFGEISFTKAGTYVYTLTEVDGGVENYVYDKSVYTVTVTVTDNSRGKLTAKVSLSKDGAEATAVVFRNSFAASSITYDVLGEKVLTGRQLQPGEFQFVLINAATGQQIGEAVTNGADGQIAFRNISLATTGIYHFKITERAGDAKGVSYDTTAYHIRLEVEQNEKGLLTVVDEQLHKATVTKQEVNGVLTEVTKFENITGGKIQFHNLYSADPASVTLEATKTLTGRPLADGEFKFDLHATGADYAISQSTLVQNDEPLTLKPDGTGSVVFMPELFTREGVYYFVIVEDEIERNGVKPDTTEYQVEITVTDNHAGDLVATVKVGGEAVTGSTATVITFRNTYSATADEIKIAGTKTLQGRDLQEEEFSFQLFDAEGKLLQTVKNGKLGAITFAPISVNAAGTYTYTVKELVESEEGMTYDERAYTVTVTVTDNLDGTYKIEYAYAIGETAAEGIAFVNSYEAPQEPEEPDVPDVPDVPDEPEYPEPPKTGDESFLLLALPMMILSATAALAVILLGKKKAQ